MVLLTDKEIVKARHRASFSNYYWNEAGATTSELEIAKAQLKKVVEWLHEDIRREIHPEHEVVVFRKDSWDWQALLKELDIEL